MAETYQLDTLDRAILQALMANARTAYAELAKHLNVSPGTVHVRVEKNKTGGHHHRGSGGYQPETAGL